jgi:hypothetical protein
VPIGVLDDDLSNDLSALVAGEGALAFLPIKYATAITLPFSLIKAGSADLAVSADWTPATGDVKVRQDSGTYANVATLPSIVSGTDWGQPLSTGETTGKFISIQVVDSATKAVEDQKLMCFTYGHASAYWPFDLSLALPTNFPALSITAGGLVTLAGVTHTGAVIPTVTDVTTKTGYSLANPAGAKKNAALPNVPFEMRDSVTGLLRSGLAVTAQRRIDSGSFAPCANAVTEIGTTGIYTIDIAATDVNGDCVMFLFTATGSSGTSMFFLLEP